MKRRKFLKKSLQTVPVLWTTPSILSSCKKEETSITKTVIVVGAGIAGLAAAQRLKNKGFTVSLLEAQEKVGGRLRSNRSLGIAFDEGASWIHGITKNPITDLAEQAGMKSFHTEDSSRKSYDVGGIVRSAATYDQIEDEFYDMLDTLMKKGNASQSFQTVFNAQYPTQAKDRLWKFFLSTYLTFDTGDLDKLSSLLYNEGEEFKGIEKIATNGYDTIANHLARGLNVQLNQRVTKIDYTGNKVQVTHNGQTSSADYVILTVPLGVLKKGVIQFAPNLPAAKLNAIQKIGMSCVNKFLLTWPTAFWDDVQYLSYTPETADKFNYFVNVNKFHPSSNALMTFAYAAYGRQTETMTDSEIKEAIMAHLKDMYGNSIPNPNPSNLLRTKWSSNENAYGAYSFTAIGTEMRHFEDLAEPLDDKLFFAGEHTEVDYFSTAHGAYLSGLREANNIIDLQ
ncbi:MAG: NAD(P)/FAD-dependent oxidoreductase [Haliscomenobacter sp.]|uniref:NAD(P)/FAD-dependent oxidoreductase n=1 Tax=Haliscomenobacter sp. TaxID=2717303 RepID=UPI0029AB53A0|nr:NAD(P)/FAD-dependent oxidoreductase [Haliscomenobacter sp.]MDX2070695.1 NAD(P)/FAD-dependent oxidoreductase [Haliscomenobacter sp.]